MSTRVCRICNKEFHAHTRSVICEHEHIYECPICGKHIKLKRFKDIESIIMKTHLNEGTFCIIKEKDNQVIFTMDFKEKGFGACHDCRMFNRDIIKQVALNVRKKTNLKLFGTENAFQNEDIKEKCRRKHQENYGVDNPFQAEDIKNKIKDTGQNKYGVQHPMKNIDIQQKAHLTYKSRTGYDYPTQDPEVREKMGKSAKEHGNNSSLEDQIFLTLQQLNANEGVDFEQEYNDEKRYPFNCDFYFPRTDIFLEINGYGTHGFHGFNKNNKEDIQTLNEGKNKATENHPAYEHAIDVWTVRDPLKRKTAVENSLNYIVLWNKQEVLDFCEHKLKNVVFGG